MKKKQRQILLFTAVTATCLYHAVNLVAFVFLPSPVSNDSQGKYLNLASVSDLIPSKWASLPNHFDRSINVIRGTGYLLRYLAGEEYPLVLIGTKTPHLSLFDRRDSEFVYQETGEKLERTFVPAMKEWIETLTAKGVEVVVLPIPPKQAVEREKLPQELPPEYPWTEYLPHRREDIRGNFRRLLSADSSHMVDLFSHYMTHRDQNPQSNLYIPWDLHWSSEGIALAAQKTLDHLYKKGWPVGQYRLNLRAEAPLDHTPRLLSVLQLPGYYKRRSPNLRWREPLYTLEEEVPPRINVEPETVKRVVLIGSSFCNRFSGTPYHLGNMLASALKRELIANCMEGGGNWGALAELKRDDFHLRKGDLLVYEVLMPEYFEKGKPYVPTVD